MKGLEKNAAYCLQISALVLEMFVFEKCVKYANRMTDDIIHSTQNYMKHINRAILANHKSLKLRRLIHVVLIQKFTYRYKKSVPIATLFQLSPPT